MFGWVLNMSLYFVLFVMLLLFNSFMTEAVIIETSPLKELTRTINSISIVVQNL